MKIRLALKAMSINAAWQGRRFKTKECKQYCDTLDMILPAGKVEGEYFELTFRFGLVNFSRCDEDNLIKSLQDRIVAKGIIIDDRRIVRHVIEKYPCAMDWIEVDIRAVPKPPYRDLETLPI